MPAGGRSFWADWPAPRSWWVPRGQARGSQQAEETPIGEKFWPSEFGADDQRGAANRITPAKVVSAARLVHTGQIYQLGRLYEHGMPIPGKRHFSLTIPGLPTATPTGSNKVVSNDELVSGEIGQVGTQFDGLGHVGARIKRRGLFLQRQQTVRVWRYVRSQEARSRERRRFLYAGNSARRLRVARQRPAAGGICRSRRTSWRRA